MSIRYNIGGSATINGVIMINSSTGKIAKAVRERDGSISVKEPWSFNKLFDFYKSKFEKRLHKVPAIREIIKLLLMLFFSVSSFFTGFFENFTGKRQWSLKRILSLLFFLVGVYVFLFADDISTLIFLGIFILFFSKEIGIILRYHGAEHKCINMYEGLSLNNSVQEDCNAEPNDWKQENRPLAYEENRTFASENDDLTVENAKMFSKIHYRCGTNIIVLLLPLCLLYYFFAEQYLLSMFAGGFFDTVANLVLIGISVELFRLFQKPIMRWVLKPGILIQRFITTKEPGNDQLEVALAALKAVI